MSDFKDDIGALRKIWPASERMSDNEVRSLAATIREKDRTIRSATRAQNWNALVTAVLMAVITLFPPSRARWVWAQVGYGLCAASYATALIVLVIYRRRDRMMPEPGLEMRVYYDELIRFHDRQIGFLRTGKYWFLLPILAGVALIGLGIWVETGNLVTSILVGAVVPVIAWIAIYYMNDVRAIGDLRERRRQVTAWMEEVGLPCDEPESVVR